MSPFDNQSYDPSILDIDSDAYSTPDEGKTDPVSIKRESDSAQSTDRNVEGDAQAGKKNNKKSSKSKEKPVDNGPSTWSKIIDFFCDKRTHGAIGLLLIGFSAYVLIASLSFFVSGSKDMSAISGQSIEQLAENPGSIENLGGPTGAVMSQVILTNSFGVGALVMLFYLITIGLALLRVTTIKFWSFTFKSLLIAVTLSMVAGLATYGIESEFLWGGQHGRFINMLLIQRFGLTGAIIVSVVLVGLIAIIYLNELIALYKLYRAKVNARRERKEQERLERERLAKENEPQLEPVNVAEERQNTLNNEEQPGEDVVFGKNDIAPANGVTLEETTEPTENPAHENRSQENSGDSLLVDISALKREIPERTESDEHEEGNITIANTGDNDSNNSNTPADVALNTVQVAQDLAGGAPIVAPTTPESTNLNASGTEPADDQPASENEVPLEVIHNQIEKAENIDQPFDPTAELSHYHFPPLDLLIDHPNTSSENTVEDEDKERIIRSLREYGININKIDATVGPTVTLFEIVPEEGTRIQQIKRLEDDLMRSLSAVGIRIVAPIPGKGTIGIEVPNKNPQTVGIRAVLSSKKYQEFKGELPMAMGATISNEVYVADLAKMPHLLVAGATGQGKSVGLNTIIASLIYKKHPSTLKFVLIDPKMVEFSLYSKLEHHYLAKMADEEEPIITASDRVLSTLNSLCVEMDNRYMLLKSAGVRNIKEYNEKFIGRHLNPEKGHNFLPYIVVIIDEFADLITVLGKEVETPVARITAKARAVGIHMIIATQRPSIDVITGVIKNNIPGRIAFKVPQSTDSKTILDRTGANQLIGRGDMLFLNGSNLDRVQCAFIDTPEVEAICNFIENEQGYPTPYILPDYNPNGTNEGNAGAVTDRDPLFGECARFIVQSGTASTSSLQRRYGIGYNRAGKIMDQMEAAGIVGPAMGSKPRQVILDIMALENLLEQMGV